jgi:hypothetical protein
MAEAVLSRVLFRCSGFALAEGMAPDQPESRESSAPDADAQATPANGSQPVLDDAAQRTEAADCSMANHEKESA